MTTSPAVLADPAFIACLGAAVNNRELVAEFDRLAGANLSMRGSNLDLALDQATGRMDADAERFVDFVREAVFERLPAEVLRELTAKVTA